MSKATFKKRKQVKTMQSFSLSFFTENGYNRNYD